jgi:nickel-type superoxide dismutase
MFKIQTVLAHCDLPCGVYDPAQAKIEALSVKACMEKYHASNDPDFKARAVSIKEQRSNMVKEHLWILWTDYFKPNHFEKYPQLHELFNEELKAPTMLKKQMHSSQRLMKLQTSFGRPRRDNTVLSLICEGTVVAIIFLNFCTPICNIHTIQSVYYI